MIWILVDLVTSSTWTLHDMLLLPPLMWPREEAYLGVAQHVCLVEQYHIQGTT